MTGRDPASLIEGLWALFVPVVQGRIATVAAGVQALETGASAGDAPVRDAHVAAHSLAGALGSYGRTRAGDTAREVMIALEGTRPDTDALRVLLARIAEELW